MMTNYKERFAIYTKTTNPNGNVYTNGNRFIRCTLVDGEQAMREKVAQLELVGDVMEFVYNGIGEKVKL
jgi:hypothetical protein